MLIVDLRLIIVYMKDLKQKLIEIKKRIVDAISVLKLTEKESELDLLESQVQKPTFWEDRELAGETTQKINALKQIINPWREMERDASDLLELLETIKEGDPMLAEIQSKTKELEEKLAGHETETYFSGKYDGLNAILSIYSGAGGVDAQDWAEMLLSMYLKYADLKKLEATIIHLSAGSEAGLKSVTIEIRGPFAYGLLKSERGVHRLVRLSPYDADKARHTSFALVEVIPEIEKAGQEVPESELKIDTFRASGHGGQSVNTTDSAVRITHVPTGTTVSVQNERSQLQNKAKAMTILRARLATLKEAEHEKELKIIKGESMSAEWGSQIRSYVIHPYQMVKDHRTGTETSDTQGVLNGDLDKFIESYLKGPKP